MYVTCTIQIHDNYVKIKKMSSIPLKLGNEFYIGSSNQNHRDAEAYQNYHKKIRCACFTILNSMHNDLISEFEEYGTAQEMWTSFKARFEGTIMTRLRTLTMKLDTYRVQRGDYMAVHLRKMLRMISELKVTGNNLFDEQQIQAVIRSLPNS